jgi:hypothetical protein
MAARIIEAGNSLANFPYRGRSVPGAQLRETTLPGPTSSATGWSPIEF